MTLSARDRRILLFLVPVVVLVAYWFLILSPKRDDLSAARDQQHQAEQSRDQTVAQAAQLEHARESFAADYAEVVHLGKAIPDSIDSPSLLVQLDRAAKGTHIDFDSVAFGASGEGTTSAPSTPQTQAPTQPEGNAAAGGAPAQTGPGRQVENAENTVTGANQASAASENGTGSETDTNVSTTAGATSTPTTTAPAALDKVPLTFNFNGSYFDLADFFHRLKRFVYVLNNQIVVRGRLLTIDTLSFSPGTGGGTSANSDNLTATVGATVYLTPKAQGLTAGATPAGPPGTTTAAAPAGSQTSSVPFATAGAP